VDAARRLWATDHALGRAYLLSQRSGRPVQMLRGCPGAHHIDSGPGRGRVVVACHDNGSVLVYDPVRKQVDSIAVGAGPHGVAVAFTP
jgi:hypothetical protein